MKRESHREALLLRQNPLLQFVQLQRVQLKAGQDTAFRQIYAAFVRFVAAVNRDEDYGIVYRVSDGKKMRECSFGGHSMKVAANDTFANPRDRVFALNRDGTMLAVSFQGGGLGIFDLENPDMVLMILEASVVATWPVHSTFRVLRSYAAIPWSPA